MSEADPLAERARALGIALRDDEAARIREAALALRRSVDRLREWADRQTGGEAP